MNELLKDIISVETMVSQYSPIPFLSHNRRRKEHPHSYVLNVYPLFYAIFNFVINLEHPFVRILYR